MKQLLLASTVLVFAGQVQAADLRMPVKAPVAVAPHYTWTGCYVGGHVGAGWGKNEISETLEPPFPSGQNFAPVDTPVTVDQRDGLLGGAHVGCDYQLAPNWVVGAVGDFSWASIEGQ